jgi:hypothetical protein
MGIGSTNGVVGGLTGVPLPPDPSHQRRSQSPKPPPNWARALKPFFWIKYPALVKRPALIMSRRLNRAAIISRRFFAAFLISLSRLLFLFEILAIGDLSFEDAWQHVRAKVGCGRKYFRFEGAVKPELTGENACRGRCSDGTNRNALTTEQSANGSGKIYCRFRVAC